MKVIYTNIRFWIFFFFIIRLIGITNPPLEVAHNWRQTTVTMVSRNFLEVNNNILYPRIDIAGNKTGITGMEFPVLNYLIYLISLVFGYQHWYGRLINLIISSFGLFFFFKLIEKYFSEKIAFSSTLILICSIWFSYSRKIMPDTFSASFILAGIYYGTKFLDRPSLSSSSGNLLLYIMFVMLGSLSKLPASYLLIIFSIPLFHKNILFKRKIIFLSASIISVLPATIWYLYWVPHLVETFGCSHFFMGKNFNQGINEIIGNLPKTLQKFYEDALKFIGFAIFIFGIIHAIIKKNELLLHIIILSFASFLIVIFKAGFTFAHHSYYIIPFVPVMALVAGYGLEKLNNKIKLVILIAICLEGILNQQHDFRIHEKEFALLNLEDDLNKVSGKKDLILINSGQYPTPMYFAHRKGWVEPNEKVKDEKYIQMLKDEGLQYIVILKKTFGTIMDLNLPIVLENEDYRIYQIKNTAQPLFLQPAH